MKTEILVTTGNIPATESPSAGISADDTPRIVLDDSGRTLAPAGRRRPASADAGDPEARMRRDDRRGAGARVRAGSRSNDALFVEAVGPRAHYSRSYRNRSAFAASSESIGGFCKQSRVAAAGESGRSGTAGWCASCGTGPRCVSCNGTGCWLTRPEIQCSHCSGSGWCPLTR